MKWDRYFEPFLEDIWVGRLCILAEVSQIFTIVTTDFFQKMSIFRDFLDTSTKTTPKQLFAAFLLTNFPKMSKKVLKIFSQFLESNREKRISVKFISLNKHTAKTELCYH